MLPLTHWQLYAPKLPESLAPDAPSRAFVLPGADALSAFADLIGGEDAGDAADAPAQEESAPIALPAMPGGEIEGAFSLKKKIDFGALSGDRAILTLDHIAGSGEILLDGETLVRFGGAEDVHAALCDALEMTAVPCRLAVNLTDALRLGREGELEIRFTSARPAGICGPVCLHTATRAHLFRTSIAPDPLRRTAALRTQIHAEKAGRYVLRARTLSGAIKETSLTLAEGETCSEFLSLDLHAGAAYAGNAMHIQLFYRPMNTRTDGLLCDSALLAFGAGTKPVRSYVPLAPGECAGDPCALAARLSELHIPAVSLPVPAYDCLCRALGKAGIAVRVYTPVDDPLRAALTRHACVCASEFPLEDGVLPLETSAWQLCGPVTLTRTAHELLTPAELLYEAAGREIDLSDARIQDVLRWLRAVLVRLRAEAARQDRYQGALCTPDEALSEDIKDALCTAFAPVHLSALPLHGAWWTGTHFSAALEAYFSQSEFHAPVTARCTLEDESGHVLAEASTTLRKPGYAGMIDAVLPDTPCVLTLHCMLLCGETVLEQNEMPVYVGEKGPLEAAF